MKEMDRRAGGQQLLLTNIQRFSLHDGPGIRTTVFLKGCSLRCPWCSNPENREPHPEPFQKDGTGGTYGQWYGTDALFKEILKDEPYYGGTLPPGKWRIPDAGGIPLLPGGVTFSGGEPLLQARFLAPLLDMLGDRQIHRCVESCLYVPEDLFRGILTRLDFFYADIKILSARDAAKHLGGELPLFLSNLHTLLRSGIPTVLRIPVIGGYTDLPANRHAVKDLLASCCAEGHPPLKLELLREHHLGFSKFLSLGLPEPALTGVSPELMEQYKEELSGLRIPTEILDAGR